MDGIPSRIYDVPVPRIFLKSCHKCLTYSLKPRPWKVALGILRGCCMEKENQEDNCNSIAAPKDTYKK
ncbi:unnamed protein product [Allacma fusca]|uniref:Uncharacterized protein n=1 Tax=Allacma fusca TaxID=39272 RepID=A0A8J2K5V5_9HEXA|nr:unnamed protein product [Allacma fusca]